MTSVSLDRLAHVQDIDLTVCRHGTGLHDQLCGLGDGHKITDNIGVGYRYRTTGLNLLFKQRHNTSVTSQYITKTHGNILCF